MDQYVLTQLQRLTMITALFLNSGKPLACRRVVALPVNNRRLVEGALPLKLSGNFVIELMGAALQHWVIVVLARESLMQRTECVGTLFGGVVKFVGAMIVVNIRQQLFARVKWQ